LCFKLWQLRQFRMQRFRHYSGTLQTPDDNWKDSSLPRDRYDDPWSDHSHVMRPRRNLTKFVDQVTPPSFSLCIHFLVSSFFSPRNIVGSIILSAVVGSNVLFRSQPCDRPHLQYDLRHPCHPTSPTMHLGLFPSQSSLYKDSYPYRIYHARSLSWLLIRHRTSFRRVRSCLF